MSEAFERLAAAGVRDALVGDVVPGFALGILHAGREEASYFGRTSVEDPLPVNDRTLFQIGSTTKTMTGTVAMRLVAQGRLDLDAPIRTYLPELRLADEDVARQVTVRHLLTHSAGWLGDYFEDTGRGADALEKIVAKLAELPQLTPVGSEWHYGNSGFYLVGRVIEVITGGTYEDAMHELLFEPLGMRMSFFFPEHVIAHRHAVGHYVREGRPEVVRTWALHRSAHPAGGVVSTIPDQLRYVRFHLGDGTAPDGTRLLAPEALASMREPAWAGARIGLTWWLRDLGGVRLVSHGGTTAGQQSELVLVPDRDFAITVLTNSSEGHALGRAICALAYREYLGLDEPQAVRRDVTAAELAAYAGTYLIGRSRIDLAVRGGALWMSWGSRPGVAPPPNGWPPFPPPARLAIVGDDELLVLDGTQRGLRAQFVRRPDGSIAWLRWGLRLYAPEAVADAYPARGGGLVS